MRLQRNQISCRSLYDLPILPFLAPRIFTVCPATLQTRFVYTNSPDVPKCVNRTNESSKAIPVEVCSFGARKRPKGSIDILQTAVDSDFVRNTLSHKSSLEPNAPGVLYTTPNSSASESSELGKREFQRLQDSDWDSVGETERFLVRRQQNIYSESHGKIGGSAVTGVVSPEQNGGDNISRSESTGTVNDIRLVEEQKGKIRKEKRVQRNRPDKVATPEGLFSKKGRNNTSIGDVSGTRSCRHLKGDSQTRSHLTKGRPTRFLLTKAFVSRYLLVCRRTKLRRLHPQLQRLWSGRLPKRKDMIAMKINIDDAELVESFRSWRVRIAYIFQQFNTSSFQPPLQDAEDTKYFKNIERLISETSSKHFLEAWERFDVSKREELWEKFILEFLHKDPASALKFLVLTCIHPLPPFYAITDTLEYLSIHFLKDANFGIILSEPLFKAVLNLIECTGYGYFYLTQNTIRCLLRYLDPEEVERFYVVLIRNKNPMSRDILKFVAYILAHSGRADVAVDVLQRLYDAGADFNKCRIRGICAVLLRKKNIHDYGSEMSDSELFAFMLKLGLQPDIVFYNILLQNSLEAGDHETAWQIHDMMLDSGINPDEYTYSHLLRDAKVRMDRSKVEDIIRIIESKGIASEHLLNDILHAMSLFEYGKEKYPCKAEPRHIFDRILEIYRKYFQVGPLSHLIPGLNSDQTLSNMHPSRVTLCLMITLYIRGLKDDYSIMEWYKSFRKLVSGGHPIARELVTTSHIYDTVIMCLGRFSERLDECREITDDMIASFEEFSGSGHNYNQPQSADTGIPFYRTADRISWEKARNKAPQSSNSPIHSLGHCTPSACTWAILLRAYMHHGQTQEAERVLGTIRSHGLDPNDMTWYSLVTGYARMQDIPNTVDAIRRLESEGHAVDEKLMSRLRSIQDRRLLIQAMIRRHENHPVKKVSHLLQNNDEAQDSELFLKQILFSIDKAGRDLIAFQGALHGLSESSTTPSTDWDSMNTTGQSK